MFAIKIIFVFLIGFNLYGACYKDIINSLNLGNAIKAKHYSNTCLKKEKIRIKDEFDEYEDNSNAFKKELDEVFNLILDYKK